MYFPFRCPCCHRENWIDLDRPLVWRSNPLVVVEGYICQSCKKPMPFFYYTRSMEDFLTKLNTHKPTDSSFGYLLHKAIKKSKGIRAKYG